MSNKFSIIAVIEAITKWYKPIIIITVIVFVVTYVITIPKLGIVPPKYESIAIFFPANLSLLDRPYLFESEMAVNVDVEQFGGGNDADRLVSIASSTQIKIYAINKFHLIEHYKIKEKKELKTYSTL